MLIRPVENTEQIRRVAALAEVIWQEHFTPIIGRAQVAYMLDKFQSAAAIEAQIRAQAYAYYLLFEGEAPFGYLAFVEQAAGLFLSKFYIRAEQRGRGHGRAALAWLEREARQRGLAQIHLTVNRHNAGTIAAYRALGFAISGEQLSDIGGGFVMDDYCMAKALEAPV